MIEKGTPDFRRTNLALFAAGLATFALLYCVQPLMPVFAGVFHIGAASSSLSLSVTTLPLAFAMLVASAVSEVVGRKPVMVASLLVSGVLAALCAGAQNYSQLLVLRGLMGLSLSGLPAVAMAYVAEEMHPSATGLAMGLYIGGSAIGGMSGRLLSGALADFWSWRAALGVIGLVGLVCGVLLWRYLPDSRHFVRRPWHPGGLAHVLWRHLRRPVLPWLFAEGFLLMGAFVAVYNYIGFRLSEPPFGLSQTIVGTVFVVYLGGVASSAFMGNLALKIGRRVVMSGNILLMLAGLALTMASSIIVIVAGVAVLTAGFFGAHSVASSWVGFRANEGRAQASSLYLFAYYAGSSLLGSAGGFAWSGHAWAGVAVLAGVAIVAALAITRLLPEPPAPLVEALP